MITFGIATFAFGQIAPSFGVPSREPGRVAAAAAGAQSSGTAGNVTVEVDGLRLGVVPAAGTVRDALAAFGLEPGAADRILPAPEAPLVHGLRVVLDRGFPVTLVDGGRATLARSNGQTVRGFLAALAVALGPDDTVAAPLDRVLVRGDVVKVVRVDERQVTEVVPYPFRTRLVEDPDLDPGRQVVETRGVSGEVSEAYLVRFVDGVETERTLISTILVRSPITEVRRIGGRAIVPPPAPAEIDQIIRAAAARWGANPEQLLRVAWCESRFDPQAYNPGAGDSGLFQFIPATWAANSVRAGYAGASVFDPVANANVAAYMFACGSYTLWTCR